jgi:hypothetical protein
MTAIFTTILVIIFGTALAVALAMFGMIRDYPDDHYTPARKTVAYGCLAVMLAVLIII